MIQNYISDIIYSSVSHSFSRKKVLEDISLSLKPGKAILLSGANGTGKTTLMRIMSGLLKPNTGHVDLGHGVIALKHAKSALLRSLMYLHQTPYMFQGTVYRNLALATSEYRDKQQKHELICKALDWAMLNEHQYSTARTLSGGQQQRVSLARAWIRQTPFILLDEPTANMDSASTARTIRLLKQLKLQNIGLVIASHSPLLFEELTDDHIQIADHGLITDHQANYQGNVTPISIDRNRA